MKINRNNKKTATAIFVMLTMAVSLIAAFPLIQKANATTFYPFLTISPNPIGVGQSTLIIGGLDFPTRGFNFPYYTGFTVIVTDPAGKTQTLGPYNADATGLFSQTFIPSLVGTYSFKLHYSGGSADFANAFNVTVPVVDSPVVNLTVQQEQLTYPSDVPVPTNYWGFPIYGDNFAWTNIAGNWLMPGYDTGRQFDWGAMSGAYNPYTTIANTTHILWTKPTQFGGIVTGTGNYPWSYYTGSSYIRALQPPIIINGRMYYKEMREPREGWYCIDLATGQQIWFNNGTFPSATGSLVFGQDAQIGLGQILTLDTRNWHGGIAYLWSTAAPAPAGQVYGSTWAVWDAWTGALQYTIKNAPSISTDAFTMTFLSDNTGTLYTYIVDANSSTMAMWNSTLMIGKQVSDSLGNIGREKPQFNIDWQAGVQWNVTLPVLGPKILQSYTTSATNVTQVTGSTTAPTVHIAAWDPKDLSVLILTNQTRGNYGSSDAFTDMAVSGLTGQVLWQQVRNEGTWEEVVGSRAMSVKDGIYTITRKETMQLYAYDVKTGNKLWTTDPRANDWGVFVDGTCIAYGKVFWISYDGELWANDAKTGALDWKFGPIYAGLETPYGWYPLYGGMTVADNKIIVFDGEHSANSPLYRGEQMHCIDVNTGTQIWSMPGWWQQPVAANGLVIAPNSYDGQIYTFGKGPTLTTVSAPDTVITQEQSIVIKGSVVDNSAGAKQDVVAKNFPNGLPVVSDESMTQWMTYVYQQKPMPTNATGVTVNLDVIDANNNFRSIGTAKTDITGAFSFIWQPDIPGKYTLIASFPGSNSYYGSSSETAFGVTAAQPATSTTVQTSQEAPVGIYFIASTIAIIVAIAIVGVLMLRKRQ